MVISKSLHKRGQSTRKLASMLTIPGPQCSKDTAHRYMRFDLWSLFMQDGKWLQFSKEWQKWTIWRLEKDYIYRRMSTVQCTCKCLELAKITEFWPKTGQKWNPFKIPSLLQKSWFVAQRQLQVCPSYMCCLQTKLWEQSITKQAFSFYFYLMMWIRPVIMEKLQKEDLWKHVEFDIVAGPSTSSQGHRNSKSALKQFFSILNQKLMNPKTHLACLL